MNFISDYYVGASERYYTCFPCIATGTRHHIDEYQIYLDFTMKSSPEENISAD